LVGCSVIVTRLNSENYRVYHDHRDVTISSNRYNGYEVVRELSFIEGEGMNYRV
jgi:hypothetical protein